MSENFDNQGRTPAQSDNNMKVISTVISLIIIGGLIAILYKLVTL